MVTIKLNGKAYRCKTRRAELTCSDLERIYSEWDIHLHPTERDYAHLVCILSGIPKFEDKNLGQSAQEAIWLAVKDILPELFSFGANVPESLTIDGRKLVVEANPRLHSTGANIVLRQAIDKTKYLQQSLSIACAVYLQPQYDGVDKFDSKSALRLQQTIKRLPAEEVYGLGFFILRRAALSGQSLQHVLYRTLYSLRQKLSETFLNWPTPGSSCAIPTYYG